MRSELGDAAFQQCAAKGSVLREEQVVGFALDALNRAAPPPSTLRSDRDFAADRDL
jgi:hypothetical protein